jgi:hypothetical protein
MAYKLRLVEVHMNKRIEAVLEYVNVVSKHIRSHIVGYFILSLILYHVAFFFFLFVVPISFKEWFEFKQYAWFRVALIIGAIYVLIPVYYFVAHYLLPYAREFTSAVIEQKDFPKIGLWILQWAVPTILIQIFVIFGFYLINERSPLGESIFSHPYKYGQMFKGLESLNNSRLNSPEAKGADYMKLKDWQAAKEYHLRLAFLDLKDSSSLKELLDDPYVDVPSTLSKIENSIYKIPFLIAMAFGFLGTLIYTLKDLAYRFYTDDLLPKTFVNYLIRFIMVAALCLVIAYFFQDNWLVNISPILFFFIGFFPDRAVQFIQEKAMSALGLKKQVTQELPLELMQGMTDYIAYRFREVGIGDAQNLAFVDLSYLESNLGFDRRIIYDFVAQALLLINVNKEDFVKFQNHNIRDIISLKCMIDKKLRAEEIPSILREKISLLSCIFENKVIKDRINMLNLILTICKKREMDQTREIGSWEFLKNSEGRSKSEACGGVERRRGCKKMMWSF